MNALEEPTAERKLLEAIRRAYQEFLQIPTYIVALFLVLAILTIILEAASFPWVETLESAIGAVVFTSPDSTREFLSTTTGAIITVTSITFTVLLLAMQQAASNLTAAILDQFLRRRLNQLFFGYFVGVTLYAVLILAVAGSDFNPVLSATLTLIFIGLAVFMLAALVPLTVEQVRPAVVVQGIHDGSLNARKRELKLIGRTRQVAVLPRDGCREIRSRSDGFVAGFDLEAFQAALGDQGEEAELVLAVRVGSFVAYDDLVAEIRGGSRERDSVLGEKVLRAVTLVQARDLTNDPLHGIQELVNIGWTSISTAKHNPMAGLHAIYGLRDLLARWTREEDDGHRAEPPLPVVYQDGLLAEVVRGIGTLAVAASESKHSQSFAAVVEALATMLDRLPQAEQRHVESIVLRLIPALSGEVLSEELEDALGLMAEAMDRTGGGGTARALRAAREELGKSVGTLGGAARG